MSNPILRRAPLKVLVVDDSVFNRRSIAHIFASSDRAVVVGNAADGEEALRLVQALQPDVITLDLEMPKMDGFTFLRILMSKMPTPVIVVSSYSQKENVFKALELGALDFVAKPDRQIDSELSAIREELLEKVLLVDTLRPAALATRRKFDSIPLKSDSGAISEPPARRPERVLAFASSTGGPTALMEIFGRLPRRPRCGIVIAQHMPDKFTRTFAERLDRRSKTIRVSEAQEADVLTERTAFICPGRRCLELEADGESLRLRVRMPAMSDRYVPSADRLFASVAEAEGENAVGVILTGMGDDGVEGARKILDAGGTVLAESEETAVVYGMPGTAVRAGVVTRSLPLSGIADWIAAFC